MTSPVDTTVKNFNNTMAGAPVLSGTAGSLIALLDACLKDGFDTKSLTSLVAASGVMTATFAGVHSSQADSVVLIAGVAGGPTGFADANGEQKVTVRPSATTAQWATTLPDGTYTGTITMKMAPAGWLKPFTGTDRAVYKSASGEAHGGGMCFRVDDAGAQAARVVGYETMSDVDTGTGPFPTPAQMSGGGYWSKSLNANGTAVAWALVADSRFLILFVAPGISSNGTYFGGATRCFGDLIPRRAAGDAFAVAINYHSSASVASQYQFGLDRDATSATLVLPRNFTGLGSATALYPARYTGGAGVSGADNALGPFPNVITGEMYLSHVMANVSGVGPRADVPGLLTVPQTGVSATINFGDRVPGTGGLAGRNLLALTPADSGYTNSYGVSFVDITGPWR